MKSVGFNDCLSGFSWNNLTPKKEIVDPAPIAVPSASNLAYVQTMDGVNNSSQVQWQTITLDKSKTQTTTVTVTNQYTAGMEMSFTIANEIKNTTVTWSVQINFSYTRTEGLEMSKTDTSAIAISQEYNVPPTAATPP